MELEAGSNGNMYQISYSEEDVGRMVKSSKIRITWEFVGNNGRRHEIVLSWSKTTGKQKICMDGAEIWFGRNKGRSVLDHNWTTQDETLKLHVMATCAPPMNATFRSFDLMINGQLFINLPQHDSQSEDPTYFAPLLPMGNNHLNSIIQILYPNGYAPPLDKDQQQQQQQREEERQRQQPRGVDVALRHDNGPRPTVPMTETQNLHQNIPAVVSSDSPALEPSTRNGASHQPIVDLLM